MAVESIYSMEGDGPDLGELHTVAQRHEAVLVVDEAHATGVLGAQGRGRAAFLEGREDAVLLHTCGKALGTAGALLCAPRVLKEFLVNRGRPFIYATAPSPLIAAVTRAALVMCAAGAARRERLQALVAHAARAATDHGWATSGSHIVPLLIGEDAAAAAAAARLQARGFDVRAIRPPTVPAGTARLRIALTLNVDAATVDALFQTLKAEGVHP
jgi:8-amino-7-oxononanoate synthase